MKKNILLGLLLLSFGVQAQNVGVGTNVPAASAKLDITSTNSGVLIPRVALTMTTAAGPVAAPANSLLVYNTATAGDVTPGFYYWSTTASAWIRLAEGAAGWLTTGNTGIGAANFLGPINGADLNFRTTNVQRAVITAAGNMGVGDATPAALFTVGNGDLFQVVSTGHARGIDGTAGLPSFSFVNSTTTGMYRSAADEISFSTVGLQRVVITAAGRVGVGIAAPTSMTEVSSGATLDAIYGHSNQVGGYLGRETNITFGTPVQSLLGAGVYAANPASGYTSAYSQSTGLADVAASITFSSVWMASYNYVQNGSTTFNPSANYNQLNITGATLGGTQIALRGLLVRGTTAGNPGFAVGVEGLVDSQNEDAIGVQGLAFSNGVVRVGGYFEGLSYPGVSQAYAYVGGTINSGATIRKIVGTGTVSEIVPTENHGRVTLTCPESPEYWYQDYGTVQLVNGRAHVDLDPILADIIVVDAQNPIRPFFTPADMLNFNGAAIMNQTPTGFDIVELNGGTNSGTLHYQLTLKPKTNYGEGRFPQAPGPAYLKADKEPLSAKAKNQPKETFHWPADYEVYKYDPVDMINIGDIVPAGPHAGKVKLANGKFGENIPANRSELGLK